MYSSITEALRFSVYVSFDGGTENTDVNSFQAILAYATDKPNERPEVLITGHGDTVEDAFKKKCWEYSLQ